MIGFVYWYVFKLESHGYLAVLTGVLLCFNIVYFATESENRKIDSPLAITLKVVKNYTFYDKSGTYPWYTF